MRNLPLINFNSNIVVRHFDYLRLTLSPIYHDLGLSPLIICRATDGLALLRAKVSNGRPFRYS